jgi:Holliday junction resolvasome RuvABC endonuclease subunit
MEGQTFLGIDSSLSRTGWAAITPDHGIIIGAIETSPPTPKQAKNGEDNYCERLFFIGKEITEIIRRFNPDMIGIEDLNMSRNMKVTRKLAGVMGAICYIAKHDHQKTIDFYEACYIRAALRELFNAKITNKNNCQEFLRKKYYPERRIEEIGDELDALGIALVMQKEWRRVCVPR